MTIQEIHHQFADKAKDGSCPFVACEHGVRFHLGADVAATLLVSPEGWVAGIGAVEVAGVALRNGGQPIRPWIRSLSGYDYAQFRLDTIEIGDDGASVIVRMAARGVPRLEMPYGDQYSVNLFQVSLADKPVEDRLELMLSPSALTLDGVAYRGLAYRWAFTSDTQKIHRLGTLATWEIGGQATGNTILSQGQVTPAAHRFEPDSHFTSACLQSLQRFGDPTAMSFQLGPRWGVHQCFDFLAHDKGTLLGCWTEKHDTRSFVQRNPGEDIVFVLDMQHWKAAASVSTAAKHILFAPADVDGMPEHVARNRWKAAYDHCTENIRSLFNIRKSRPAAERTIPYGQRLREDGVFEMRVGNRWMPSRDWLAGLAEHHLPRLAEQGIKRVITEPIVESDPTERGLICKLGESGLHTDLNVGSVCCVHRYLPAEFFGGMKAWRQFCETAHALGMEVGHWIGPHLAHHAPILQEHPDWAVKGFNTLQSSGGYPNFELAVLNWNTPVRKWILDDLKRMRDEGGLDYVWFDSFANLGMIPVDYAQEMETNTFAMMEFIADLQDIGVPTITVEGMSPVAASAAHIMDHGPDHDGGVQWIAGQNSWSWYEENEDMLYGQQPRTWAHGNRDEENLHHRLFRCLANDCVPEIKELTPSTGPVKPRTRAAFSIFEKVRLDMVQRELLPDGRGVLWHNGNRRVLFAFSAFDQPVPVIATVECLTQNESTQSPPTGNGLLSAAAWSVYHWEEN